MVTSLCADSARILEIEKNYKIRKFKESLHISAYSRTNSTHEPRQRPPGAFFMDNMHLTLGNFFKFEL